MSCATRLARDSSFFPFSFCNLVRKKLLTDIHLRGHSFVRTRTVHAGHGRLRTFLRAHQFWTLSRHSGMGNASCQSPGAPNELRYFILAPVYTTRPLLVSPTRLIAFNSLLVRSNTIASFRVSGSIVAARPSRCVRIIALTPLPSLSFNAYVLQARSRHRKNKFSSMKNRSKETNELP